MKKIKKILIITSEYVNATRANANLVESIISEFNDDFDVHVLSLETNKENLFDDIDKKIYTIYRKKRNFLGRLLLRFIGFINIYGSKETVNDIIKKISDINAVERFETIISVINPGETAEAVYRFSLKSKNVTKILLEIDSTSNRFKHTNNLIIRNYINRCIRWEKKIYNNFDKIIHFESHKSHYESDKYIEFVDKTKYMDIPLISDKPHIYRINKKNIDEDISMIYAGYFYPKLREPSFLIRTLKKMQVDMNVSTKIYTDTKSIKNIHKMISNKNINISLEKMIKKDDLDKIICQTDILLSVGNYNSDFLPSKIFYYIDQSKPIIHFYSDLKDKALHYLRNYSLALLLSDRDTDDYNLSMIKQFIKELNSYDNLDLKIEKKYYKNTIKYNSNILTELIND